MRITPALIHCLVLALGVTSAPIEAAPAANCELPVEDRFPVITFSSWITECGDRSGHTKGMTLAYRKHNDLCRPLPDDIRGIEIHEAVEGCRVTAYRSPTCDDYPYAGAWRDKAGCLWTGNSEYRSFKVTCDE